MKTILKNILRLFRTPKEKNISQGTNLVERLAIAGSPIRLVLGSGEIAQDGWVASDISELNITSESSWKNHFTPSSVDLMIAEHVWEHLTFEGASAAAINCYKYLKSGGHLRVAVPDGLHTDKSYIEYVKPGGHGAGSDDHKHLFTYSSLGKIFRDAGFEVRLLEYFDESGKFNKSLWKPEDGLVRRSRDFDTRNSPTKLVYTSLILDAVKVS